MFGLWIWIRRTWTWVLPVLAVPQALVMLMVAESDETDLIAWSLDWSWMLSVWSGGTLLLSPTAAAISAFLVLREFPTGVSQVTGPLRRNWRPFVDIALAVWLLGLAVQLAGLVLGVWLCTLANGDPAGVTLPWQLFTGPAALLAAVFAGVLAAAIVPNLWTVPSVLFGMFLAHRIFFWEGYPELFTTEMATWMVTGARPIPAHLEATVALNLFTAVGFGAILVWKSQPPRMRPRLALVLAAICLAGALAVYLPWVLAGAVDTYEYVG